MTNLPSTPASPAKIDLYLDRIAAQNPHGRLVFALDATMSRQATWDRAVELQAEMFAEAARVGGLEMQLVYYRGDECRASTWMTDGKRLGEAMRRVECVGGCTQIGKVLKHAQQAHDKSPIAALVLVGDAMEEEIDALCAGVNKLASRGVKIFAFQEGSDEDAEKASSKSRGSRMAPIANSPRIRRRNCASFSTPRRDMPPAD
jgi:hypothetical protein